MGIILALSPFSPNPYFPAEGGEIWGFLLRLRSYYADSSEYEAPSLPLGKGGPGWNG